MSNTAVAPTKVQRTARQRLLLLVTQRFFPTLSYKIKQHWWNKVWKRKAHSIDLERTIPEQLLKSVENGWIAPGAKVVDIGCGSGELSAWLAKKGFDSVGADYSVEAVSIARTWEQQVEGRLSYSVVDICKGPVSGGPYDVLLDKGCLHGIPDIYRAAYVNNVVKSCKPNGKFLMLHRIDRMADEEEARLADLFSSSFTFEKVENIVLQRVAGDLQSKALPGLAIWMVRKAS